MNFKPQCNTQAELFAEAARVSKMCEGTVVNIYGCIKHAGVFWPVLSFNGSPDGYEFAIAIIEGKPVFRGDELYDNNGVKRRIVSFDDSYLFYEMSAGWGGGIQHKSLSWNPPLPKTVMVELSTECAGYWARLNMDKCLYSNSQIAVISACHKALDSLKGA